MANGKARGVAFVYDDEEADKWFIEILDNEGKIVHSYPSDILFPEKRGERMIYEKYVIVPETLKGGEHKLRICGLLKDKNKICKETDAFHIEGDQMKSELLLLVLCLLINSFSCYVLVVVVVVVVHHLLLLLFLLLSCQIR